MIELESKGKKESTIFKARLPRSLVFFVVFHISTVCSKTLKHVIYIIKLNLFLLLDIF